MIHNMTDAQITLLIGTLGNALLAGWTAYTVYQERRASRRHRELMEVKAKEREELMELKAAERDAKEREHRHRMAEVQQQQVFELEKMSRMVGDTKSVAVETKREISKKIDESKKDRNARMDTLEAKVDAGIEQANNYNGKIAAIGAAAMAAKSVELQQEGNAKLEEIAQNTAPHPE